MNADTPDPDPCFASLDTANNIMSINTTHFSTYGVEGVVATATADSDSADAFAGGDDDDDDDDDDDAGPPVAGGGGGAPPETPELDVTAAESSSEIFTPNTGGMVDTGSGDAVEASVEVPPGAVDQEVNIQIEAILTTDPALPMPPARYSQPYLSVLAHGPPVSGSGNNYV